MDRHGHDCYKKYMTFKYTTLSLLISTALLFPTFTTQAKTPDQLFLKNGDRLSGTIQGYDNAQVTISTAFGTLNVSSDKIAGVASPEITMADLMNPQSSQAPATPSQAPTTLTPIPAEPQAIAQATPAPVTPVQPATEPKDEKGLWGAKWSGDVNVGMEFETGNDDSENYSVDTSIKAEWEKHRLSIGAEYEREKEDDLLTTDEKTLTTAYDYFFADNWFWQNQLELEQDKVEELELRTQYNSGLGYQFYDTDDTTLEVVLGPGYLDEKYENADDRSEITAHWSLDYEQKFYDDAFRLYHNHEVSAPFEDMNAYLFESNTGATVPLKAGIVATAEIEFDWNNEPATGNVEDDTTYSLQLGYEW